MNLTMIIAKIKAQLKYREIEIPEDIILQCEIDRAIAEINRCRRFNPTESKPYDKKYEDLIPTLVIYSLARVGIEGETSHSENGVQRIYAGDSEYPQDVLSKIIPLAK